VLAHDYCKEKQTKVSVIYADLYSILMSIPSFRFATWQKGFDAFEILGMFLHNFVKSRIQHLLANVVKANANLEMSRSFIEASNVL